MPFRERILIYYKNCIDPRNALCRQSAKFSVFKPVVGQHAVITRLQRVRQLHENKEVN
jgi:hypothetical protein